MQEETETGWFMLDWTAGDGWLAATNNRLHNSLEWDMPCLNGFEGFCVDIIRPSFIPQLLEKNRCLAISDLPNHAHCSTDRRSANLRNARAWWTNEDTNHVESNRDGRPLHRWICDLLTLLCMERRETGYKWEDNGWRVVVWLRIYGFFLDRALLPNDLIGTWVGLMNLGWWSGCWNNTSWF